MKDPTIICPTCQFIARRVRKHSGYRCVNKACINDHKTVATDTQVALLKAFLREEAEGELLAWACNQNPKPHKRFPTPPPAVL